MTLARDAVARLALQLYGALKLNHHIFRVRVRVRVGVMVRAF